MPPDERVPHFLLNTGVAVRIEAPKGRNNEAQANGLGQKTRPTCPEALKGRDIRCGRPVTVALRGRRRIITPFQGWRGNLRAHRPRPSAWASLDRPVGAKKHPPCPAKDMGKDQPAGGVAAMSRRMRGYFRRLPAGSEEPSAGRESRPPTG